MPLVRARSLILQSFPYSDTSKILRLFSREYGVRSAIAKGAQRPKSRFGGLLEPFTEGEAQLYLKEGRDLHTLGGFDLLRSRQALGRNLTAFAGASLLAELVLRFATEEPHPQLFHALVTALDALAEAREPEAGAVAIAAAWEMIALLGFQPETDACIRCGRALEPDEPSRFDVEAGGVVCTRCRTHGRVVDAASRHQLRRMSHGGGALAEEEIDRSLHRALLRAFVVAHLSHEHPLRSLDLFTDLLR
ncbi:MAG TPA: DNA repair protein RecO [Longimicrobiaceae bacterium]|nr:DNA repair protein RecO [Longimicrobiaceae bacterium]